MSLSVRRNRALRGILLCCAALLFAAQTLAVAHVHIDDGACVVCPHAHAQHAADAGTISVPPAPLGRRVQPAAGERQGADAADRSFQARAPPASDR
ncbi:MAG: hypothetical protein RIB46_02505 [Pseudomonadales bacterium]